MERNGCRSVSKPIDKEPARCSCLASPNPALSFFPPYRSGRGGSLPERPGRDEKKLPKKSYSPSPPKIDCYIIRLQVCIKKRFGFEKTISKKRNKVFFGGVRLGTKFRRSRHTLLARAVVDICIKAVTLTEPFPCPGSKNIGNVLRKPVGKVLAGLGFLFLVN